MMGELRTRRTLIPDAGAPLAPPQGEGHRFSLRISGCGVLDADVYVPDPDARGVLLSYVGYGTALGPWETARESLLARASGRIVVTCELPGMSRHRTRLPDAVRRGLRAGEMTQYARLTTEVLLRALDAAGVDQPDDVELWGYSTGASLAVTSAPLVAKSLAPVCSTTLVEPVALLMRSLPTLAVDNTFDYLRERRARRHNAGHPWVRRAWRLQEDGPPVSISPTDLYAISSALRSAATMEDLDGLLQVSPRVNLVRGQVSDLCREEAFDRLDDLMDGAGVPGLTVTVAGAGHPLWHSAPTVAELGAMVGSFAASAKAADAVTPDAVTSGPVTSEPVTQVAVGTGAVALGVLPGAAALGVLPNTVTPNTVTPNAVSPGAVSPVVLPDAVTPDAVAPGVLPDAVTPDAVTPGVLPDAVAPGVLPDAVGAQANKS